MDLRTIIKVEPSKFKISYKSRVMFIGSCFATAIGMKMEEGRIPVMVNPSGTVFNPVSVSETLDLVIKGRQFSINDLYNFEGTYLSFYHYTDFSSYNPEKILERINKASKQASEFLKSADFLFITFGTARVYKWKESGIIVSNCHKIPSCYFESELLGVNDIVNVWQKMLDNLHTLYPGLKIIFTISPVRHIKDGTHSNQVSKSILILAVEELLDHNSKPCYFPAYEILMDDLRDYRFYGDDMCHPSSSAIDYLWEAFTKCYFDEHTMEIWKEISRITKAVSHRIRSDSPEQIRNFASKIIERIDKLVARVPHINLDKERRYFLELSEF